MKMTSDLRAASSVCGEENLRLSKKEKNLSLIENFASRVMF